ncbi:DUF676-domain-containing protein [Periconia macrospinosa]|uniref:DUF676-domain-containing protein n=1 Tax=Periconia macrospinosa TaxID=97972 RepID=A0A2V1EA30_9PLEO|nr:DUF676-domain-containing protein [Periconia macrospinosa]
MLLTPRTYSLAQIPDAGSSKPSSSYFLISSSRKEQRKEEQRARRMLLLHQTGSVKVGEVVRYTVTYTPSEDRILPSPSYLHVRIRNTAAMPLRAAYLHGPYSLHVAAYPSSFNPNKKVEAPGKEGVPEFEPDLKAGGSWSARLKVPEHIREVGDGREQNEQLPKSATWIVEIASQIIFSQSASVSYEVLVARDERSLDLGLTAVTGNTSGVPGQVEDHQQGKAKHTRKHSANPRGVYSKAIKLVVDDTTSLWNKPELPVWKPNENEASTHNSNGPANNESEAIPERKQKKIHLVILTHGLHSNLGADMLYLKESIDASVKQAQENRRRRRDQKRQNGSQNQPSNDASTAPLSGGQDQIIDDEDADDDEEQVVVRGFDKNVVRTERGIQYLGKRLAKHVLEMTYPDQPYLPVKKPKFSSFSPVSDKKDSGIPSHPGSNIHKENHPPKEKRAYKFTSISFIGHSLGGLVQTYAVAYIHKHSPEFFEKIKPVNFIALASPFLGMSNENPMYVKFALDFGLVGRTGQDLGLTWRAPTLARSGWTAMVNGFGGQSSSQQKGEDPGSKPLLRILPAGPAHFVLRMFRNRTVYSNVVNDGIVPLRTSCLLFLDWRGLDKVEKARRENGLIGTVATWGFSQLTGQNASPNPSRVGLPESGNDRTPSHELTPSSQDRTQSPSFSRDDTTVPQPSADTTNEDDEAQAAAGPNVNQWLGGQRRSSNDPPTSPTNNQSALSTLWNYIRPSGKHTSKDKKMFKRSQTLDVEQVEAATEEETRVPDIVDSQNKRPRATRGDSLSKDPNNPGAPPKTTIFESAGDLLSPPTPPESWIIDPSTRARAIFHDRIYHPDDIPPPPSTKKKSSSTRSFSGDSTVSSESTQVNDDGGMRVEEKIARAYHRDLSWRKVLVRLEPDAHNNIVVRRMFANAYGWPVIKHLCDTHFGDTFAAETRDEKEPAFDRAKSVNAPVREDGEHVKGQEDIQPPLDRSESEMREVADELAPLQSDSQQGRPLHRPRSLRSKDSAVWDDLYFEGTSDEDEEEYDERNALQRFLQLPQPHRKLSSGGPTSPKFNRSHSSDGSAKGTSDADIADFLTPSSHSRPAQPMEMHRGIGASPASPSARAPSTREPDSLESMGGPHHFGASSSNKGKNASASATASSPPHTPNRTSTNLSGVGLRSSFDVSSPSSSSAANEGRDRSGSGRVSEQVARMAMHAQEQQQHRDS